MTDDIEQDLARMMRNRVAEMPSSHEITPATVARVHRRRAVKFGAFATAVVVVVAGTAAAVAQAAHHGADRVSTGEPTTVPQAGSIVPTVACPVKYAVTPGQSLPTPSTAHRHISVPGADGLWSYAATTDDRYIVLGPRGWTCSTQIGADGNNAMVLYPPAASPPAPFSDTAPVTVVNDWLWHGHVGVGEACSVFTDPELVNQANGNLACALPVGRTPTRVDAHVTTFRDADGARGAGWIAYPSAATVNDGKVSILTCRPTAGLRAAECDTIVSDYVKRLGATSPTDQPMQLAPAPYAISDWVATVRGMAVTELNGSGLAAYDADTNRWQQFDGPPFAGDRYIVAARGNTVFVAGSPRSSSAPSVPFAALALVTGKWRSLARIPAGVPYLSTAGDADHIFGVGGFEDIGQTPAPHTIAVEYDVMTDRWTTFPASPLSARAGSTLAWTGSELLVWSGGSNHQGCVPAYRDGAAYDQATQTWRTLPAAPVPARYSAASVWTGTELLVWGGSDGVCGHPPLSTGAAYNPATNQWRTLPRAPLLPVRNPGAVWTGREMFVAGGGPGGTIAVAAYDPSVDTWRSLPAPAPAVREGNGVYSAHAAGRAIFGISADGEITALAYPSDP